MSAADAASRPIRVLVWGENVHEQVEPHVAAIYPDGMHTTIADGIAENLGRRRRRSAPPRSPSPSTV